MGFSIGTIGTKNGTLNSIIDYEREARTVKNIKNIKTNKFTIEPSKRRSELAKAVREMGYKVIPNKEREADKKACRGKVDSDHE